MVTVVYFYHNWHYVLSQVSYTWACSPSGTGRLLSLHSDSSLTRVPPRSAAGSDHIALDQISANNLKYKHDYLLGKVT